MFRLNFHMQMQFKETGKVLAVLPVIPAVVGGGTELWLQSWEISILKSNLCAVDSLFSLDRTTPKCFLTHMPTTCIFTLNQVSEGLTSSVS